MNFFRLSPISLLIVSLSVFAGCNSREAEINPASSDTQSQVDSTSSDDSEDDELDDLQSYYDRRVEATAKWNQRLEGTWIFAAESGDIPLKGTPGQAEFVERMVGSKLVFANDKLEFIDGTGRSQEHKIWMLELNNVNSMMISFEGTQYPGGPQELYHTFTVSEDGQFLTIKGTPTEFDTATVRAKGGAIIEGRFQKEENPSNEQPDAELDK